MTDDTREAWRDVLTQIDALADSMGRWTRAAIDDPENRRHAAEIRAKLDTMADKVGSALDEAAGTDVGTSVRETAEKAGHAIADAGGRVAETAAPHVAAALSDLADALGRAAERVGKAAERQSGGTEGGHGGDVPPSE